MLPERAKRQFENTGLDGLFPVYGISVPYFRKLGVGVALSFDNQKVVGELDDFPRSDLLKRRRPIFRVRRNRRNDLFRKSEFLDQNSLPLRIRNPDGFSPSGGAN